MDALVRSLFTRTLVLSLVAGFAVLGLLIASRITSVAMRPHASSARARIAGAIADEIGAQKPSTYNQPPLALTPGMRLGSYEVASAIGSGGMGEVYLATDTKLTPGRHQDSAALARG